MAWAAAGPLLAGLVADDYGVVRARNGMDTVFLVPVRGDVDDGVVLTDGNRAAEEAAARTAAADQRAALLHPASCTDSEPGLMSP